MRKMHRPESPFLSPGYRCVARTLPYRRVSLKARIAPVRWGLGLRKEPGGPEKNTPLDPPSRGDNPDFLNLRIASVWRGLGLLSIYVAASALGRARGLLYLLGMLVCLGVGHGALAADWPMWRHDAGRTGVSAEALPSPFHLQWVRRLPPVRPAFRSARLQFDRGYEPVVLGTRLFVALPHSDCVAAYDTRTGAELWRFYADGPVRLAPVAWQGKLYFGSDDGYLYCLDAVKGALRWRFRAAPSARKVLGNGRLVSVWAVRGGPVLVEGIVYFAAGVWPFEGIFVYALDAKTGAVVWLNDRTGFLYGVHPHGSEGMGGLTPQGYLLVNGDDLVVPCGTARPAVLNRHTGALKSFSLPGEGRLPGGWFMTLDTQEARDVRRGKVAFDSEVNRERHEDTMHIGAGSPGIRSRISVNGRVFPFSEGLEGVSGEVHSMVAADGRLFVVTLEGELYCFGADATEPTRYEMPKPAAHRPEDAWNAAAARILAATEVESGYAVVFGTTSGRLAEALVSQSKLRVIALTGSAEVRERLRRRFDVAGIPAERLAVQCGAVPQLGLPPYLARLVVAEDWSAVDIAPGPALAAWVFECLQPYGGVAFLDLPDAGQCEVAAWANAGQLANVHVTQGEGFVLLRRAGALPGAVDYTGGWNAPDERVGAPLGILWYDDSLVHFKRAPQPLFLNGVMVSRDKDWKGESLGMGSALQAHFPGSGCFHLGEPGFMDVYTGRLLSREEALPRVGTIPEALAGDARPPYQYRPPYVDEKRVDDKAKWPFQREIAKGEMVNPMTGLKEPRRFVKSYGCDGGNDYGHLITMRSATPAFYDKRIESGTINISGPRSGCTNSVIPANGVLNIPYFYDGCSCSYPLPVGAALLRMPEAYEQWTAWGSGATEAMERVGINLGAPGDRMTEAGTLWVDYPSVGGPSPAVPVEMAPAAPVCFYHHSLWIEGGHGWPWVCASGALGLSQFTVKGLRQGVFTVRLYFVEPESGEPGQRVFDVLLQGKEVVGALDVARETGGKMRCLVKKFDMVDITDSLEVNLAAQTGQSVLCGIEIVRDGLGLDVLPASRTEKLLKGNGTE